MAVDYFYTPKSLPEAIERCAALALELTDIHAQLRYRKDEPGAAAARWRKSAVYALKQKEIVIKQYKEWIAATRRRVDFYVAGLSEDTPTEEILRACVRLIETLHKAYDLPWEDETERSLIEAARWRCGLKGTHMDHMGKWHSSMEAK